MKLESNLSLERFLEPGMYIDWRNSAVLKKALSLAKNYTTDEAIAKSCYEFVRDEIKHSWDFRTGPVTCRASDVLMHGTGYCYAKSHLLAALLRTNNIPAGLCYQRLTVTDIPPYCLHGLNAVYLERYGWYRIDARGNKEGVSAQFCPPVENPAYIVSHPGEKDLPEIWPDPRPEVVKLLTESESIERVQANLPDMEAE